VITGLANRRPARRIRHYAAVVSLLVAVPMGVGSAVAYGAATAVQHAAAHTGTGEADARRLIALVRDPRWLMSMGGDLCGFGLQLLALANGPVVLVQPLLVLTLPASLFFAALLSGTAPRVRDYGACLAILAGLTVFFLLLGTPAPGSPPSSPALAGTLLVELVAGLGLCSVVHGRSAATRAGVYGFVAGAWFGTLGVLLSSLATQFRRAGLLGVFEHAAGLVPLVGVAVIGALGMVLTQVSFQVGALAASFPANKAADPLAAVVLGAVLLHERVPHGVGYVVVDVVCLAAIAFGAFQLARTSDAVTHPAPELDGARTA
jgi:hypothetical protein